MSNPMLAVRATTPARSRGRGPRRGRSAAAAATALAALALVSACGGSSKSSSETPVHTGKQLNMHTVTASIEESFLEKRHLHATVICPTGVEQRAGNNFTCEATGVQVSGHSHKPFHVHVAVTQVNNNGYVKYVSY
jgi:hypothetical protein